MAVDGDPEIGIDERGKWAFDEDVTASFDEMLARSIPGYETMRDVVTTLALDALPFEAGLGRTATIVDLGCSRGEALARIRERVAVSPPENLRLVGVEASEPMVDAARSRGIEVARADLRIGLPVAAAGPNDVVLSVLTLQFVPIEHRPRLVGAVRDSLLPTGAFLLVEKVLGGSPRAHDVLDAAYRTFKARSYDAEAIDRKALALEGVLVPVTAAWNEDLLRSAGFSVVEPVWRCLNFAAWLALP